MRVFPVAVALLGLVACSAPPSKTKGAPTRPPDEQWETGGGLSRRVMVWKCDERNERVSMTQLCGEGLTGCGSWHVDRTLCPADAAGREATRTASERAIEPDGGREHYPIPEGSRWH